jgi:tetratricopeptide (TPR) repeat protein
MDRADSKTKYVAHTRGDEKTAQSWMAEGVRSYKGFEASGELRQLDDAIRYAKEGSSLTFQSHESHAGYLSIFGMFLGARYERTGVTKDLEEAIGTARQAVQSTPSDHPNLAMYLNNLGNWLGRRFERSREMKDLEEAIDTARQAVKSTPSDHLDLAAYLNSLGNWLGRWFERSREMEDLESLIECYLGAFDCTGAAPLERVKAAARCLNRLADLHKTHEAIKLG